jgi:hypothetical protein
MELSEGGTVREKAPQFVVGKSEKFERNALRIQSS